MEHATDMDDRQCFLCQRYRGPKFQGGPQTCEAFPNGIPSGIFLVHYDHRNPFPGDNGKTFAAVSPLLDANHRRPVLEPGRESVKGTAINV